MKAARTERAAERERPEGIERLASLIKAYAPHDGCFEMRLPGLFAIRRSSTHSEPGHGLQRAALCVVAQGVKRVMLGREIYEYDAAHMIAFPVDLPVAFQIMEACPAEPFLSLRIDLDPGKMADLALKVFPSGLPRLPEGRPICVTRSDKGMVEAAIRLMELLATKSDAELLAPLAMDEVLIRLLRSPVGAQLAQVGLSTTGVYGVEKAVSWLRENFARSVRVESLAELAHMSVSAFHQHFKAVTAMSPLQYQKALRLQEARRLMLASTMDSGAAAQQVGYLSASQFSREYGRYFGIAPTRDMAKLREQAASAAEE